MGDSAARLSKAMDSVAKHIQDEHIEQSTGHPMARTIRLLNESVWNEVGKARELKVNFQTAGY